LKERYQHLCENRPHTWLPHCRAPINKYTHNSLANKVQGLHNMASTIAHSHFLGFTYSSLLNQGETHTQGTRLSKKVLSLIV